MISVQKYEIAEFRFPGEAAGNPFDAEFSALVRTPSGAERKVTGFYDGNNEYVLRFLPEEEGSFTFRTVSSLKTLHGKEGSFLCSGVRDGNHGPVRVKDQFWFAHADGTPFFEAGTTCYAWIHQKPALREQTLDTLAKGYFNKIRMCVFPKWFEYNHREPELYPFEGSMEGGFNYDKPNAAFFQHFEQCVGKLKELGIQADIILFHPYDAPHWGFSRMSREQDRRYLRYVMARLSAYSNVWWSLANEYDIMKQGYKKRTSAWKSLISYVADQDPYGHLVSIHQFSKIYDHRDKNITHCSIQRTESYLSAEYTDQWIRKYGKPVVIDECAYEGNLNDSWGGITAQELVRRFWEATARGGYMGHGETYYGENIWWSHGGTLYGESHPRIKFLREVMADVPNLCLQSESGPKNLARATAGADTQLLYFGNNQPRSCSLHLWGDRAYTVRIIDTWNMTVQELSGCQGKVEIALPVRPYMAVLAIAEDSAPIGQFTRDSVFEQMKLYPGGRKLLRFLKCLIPQYYAGMLTMTVSDCSRAAGGILDGKAGDGILRIVNENQFAKGLFQMIASIITKK